MLFKWRWSRSNGGADDGWKHTMAPLCWWYHCQPAELSPTQQSKSRMWLSVSKTGGVVLLQNSAYGTYVDLALVHSAMLMPCSETSCASLWFSSGQKLGIGDHIVQWQRPGRCPQSMPPEDFEHYQQASKCEVHLLIQRPGFRPTEIIWSPL